MKHIAHTALLLLLLVISCARDNVTEEGTEETGEIDKLPPTEVKVEVIRRQPFNREIVSNGKLRAHKKAELWFKRNEMIRKIHVINGQYVQKGQLLAVLDDYESKNTLEKSKINLKTARIQLTDLLIGQGYDLSDTAEIPEDIYENALIRSGYSAAKNELQMARHNYELTRLHAPVSGLVANLNAKENSYPAGDAPFCIILGQRLFEIRFPVMESEVDMVKVNQKVKCVAYNNKAIEVEGNIQSINPVVDENGLIQVEAVVKSPGMKLYEGMNFKVYARKPLEHQLLIPKKAVTLRSEREVVFVYENGLAKWNYVKTGYENSESYTVTEGLNEGDSIIVEGNLHLGHDAEVVIQ